MSDILAEIDCAIGCHHCGAPLGDSPSNDFCRPECQEGWHAERSVELVGGWEPWSRSWDFPGICNGFYRPNSDLWTEPSFRIFRSTGNLVADWRAVRTAAGCATTDEQRAAVALRIESLEERSQSVMVAQIESLRLAWDGISRAVTAAVNSFTALAGFMAVELPDDPRERALVARRARGTGPTLASRPPKHIGRPSSRGCRAW